MKHTWTATAAAAAFALASALTLAADDTPDATIDFSGGSAAVGVGVSWGHGTLHYQGKDYPFRMNGLRIVDVGAQSIQGTGEVYHLGSLQAFNGTYGAADASAAFADNGAGASALRNGSGVEILMRSDIQGLDLNGSLGGVQIRLENAN
jgi:hypothetical protein